MIFYEDNENMKEKTNLEEVYDKLKKTDIKSLKGSVTVSKGFFKEEDLIKIMNGGIDLYFNIDRESIISITKNVLEKFDINNYDNNKDFNYMIELLTKIQSEVNEFFGSAKENRLAYYCNNGRIPSDDEDTRICSLSQIKGKGIAMCAEKASTVNNILLMLHEMDIFPYDTSYLNMIAQIGDELPGGHAILEFQRTNKNGEITHLLYDITNPETVEYLGQKYTYPAIYTLRDEEYKDFIEFGKSFDNKSKFIMSQWYKPTKDRVYSGFHRDENEIYNKNIINDITSRIDNSWSKKDIIKFVHVELGKVLMYDNSYSDNKENKDNDNSDMTHMSKERREKLLSDDTSLDTDEQICKGMAEISAAILSQFGIDAKVIGVEQEGDLDGIARENSDEVITVPEIYSVKFENGEIIAGDNEQTKHSNTKAQHYYTEINIDGEEYIEDFLIKETLPRIKMGETTIDSEEISGLCPKEKFRESLKTAVPMQEEFKKKLENEIHSRYGEEVSLEDKLEFIFDKLQQEESKMGYEDANKYFWFLQENIVNAYDMKQVTSRNIITFIKETKEKADIVRVYSINGKNYCVRGNLDRLEDLPPIGEISEQQIYEIINAGYEVRGFKDKESLLEITEHKEKSILDSVEEAIVADGTRIGRVNEETNIIKARENERNNPVEKDSNDIDIDED